jgi:hypothetical protein
MSNILHNNIGFIPGSKLAITFSGKYATSGEAAHPQIKKLITKLDVAPWGEDNRFPQNIVNSLESCGVAVSTLKWKADTLWGGGLVYGKVVDIDSQGNEVFQVAKKGEFKEADIFWKNNRIPRYFAEKLMDWVYFANTFEELILNDSKNKIVGIIHQESSDCRFKQMSDAGKLDTVYLSKLWGLTRDQFVKFKKDAIVKGLSGDNHDMSNVDGKYIVEKKAIDMYFPLDSLNELITQNKSEKSFILPINFPSNNKTYYQLATWDPARMSGWIDIASTVPSMLKEMYKNQFTIKYHIEVPETYFEKRYGAAAWAGYSTEQKQKSRQALLDALEQNLSGSDNAYTSIVTYFDIDSTTKNEYGSVKIKQIENKNSIDKDLLTSGTANSEIMIAMGVNPNILGAGKPGGVYASNQGGSNIREGKLEYSSNLHLERQMLLEPFRLIKEFNGWPDELEFRFKDTVLLTLDKGQQTKTTIN